ncbi:kinetochore Sim4 complex subunit FTA2-domain-containing protein [Xylariaceae sp. FL1019]|nr:kinetochore Sim4 complex subunit FTA2-domain-containing protein [Xylariaceae sp. FL1019]
MSKGLPDIIGPKTYPFEPSGKNVEIDFIKELGQGLHGVVWKVKIKDKIYALKIFNWFRSLSCGGHASLGADVLTDDEQDDYFQPFQNECRAYGRLKEFDCEELAYKCFGYIILQKEHFDFIKANYDNFETYEAQKTWSYLPDEEWYQEEPLRALVKEFVDIPYLEPLEELARTMNPGIARKAVKNLKLIHQLGICQLDINRSNYQHGKFLDFSCTMTAPHPWLSKKYGDDFPPLYEATSDAVALDITIEDWNEFNPERKIWIACTRNNMYTARLRDRPRRNLEWSPQPADFNYDKVRKMFNRKEKAALKRAKAKEDQNEKE